MKEFSLFFLRRTEFSELCGFEVSTRKMWERAEKHLADETKKTNFYKSRLKQSQFPYSENELIQNFLKHKKITLIKVHDDNLDMMEIEDFENQDLSKNKYGLIYNKITTLRFMAKKLGVNIHTLKSHWPKNIKIVNRCCKSCVECKRRDYLIEFLKTHFDVEFDSDSTDHEYFSRRQIAHLRITTSDGVKRRLNKREKEIFSGVILLLRS